MRNKIISLVLALGLAVTAVSGVQAERFRGEDCSSPPAGVQCKVAFSAGLPTEKHFVEANIGYCDGDDGLSPFTCSTSGFGAAFFNTSSWSGTNALIRVWVNWIGGGITMPDDSMEGFEVVVCSDRNDNGFCRQSNEIEDDDFIRGYSTGETIMGECSEAKGTKGGCEPSEAEIEACIRSDYIDVNSSSSDYDDIVVFINGYSTAGQQIHMSSGFFEVWVEYLNNDCGSCAVDIASEKSSDERIDVIGVDKTSEPITVLGGLIAFGIGFGAGLLANYVYDCLTDDKKFCNEAEGKDFDCYSPISGNYCEVWIRTGPKSEICKED